MIRNLDHLPKRLDPEVFDFRTFRLKYFNINCVHWKMDLNAVDG